MTSIFGQIVLTPLSEMYGVDLLLKDYAYGIFLKLKQLSAYKG